MPREIQFDREAALDKAMHAFWQRGYSATSLSDLVHTMGVNRASLYASYGDKHALFMASLARYTQIFERKMAADRAASGQALVALRKIFTAFAAGCADGNASAGCFITNTALELSAHDPEVARAVAEGQRLLEQHFVALLERARKQGEIPPETAVPRAARGLLASFLGMVVLLRSQPDRALLSDVIDEAMQRLK